MVQQTNDPLESLLRQADAAADGPPALPGNLAQQVRGLGRRQRRVRLGVGIAIPIVLFVCIYSLSTWLTGSQFRPSHTFAQKQGAPVEVERHILREGISAQLLATAELLAKEPEGYAMGLERFRQIVDDYPNTSAAILARQHLQNLNL